jgi:MazG family protein
VLDALVTEARLRFGLDPAAGLQVIASERLVATPIEPSRPVLVAPAAMLRAGGPPRAAGDDVAAPLPGRHGPRGRRPLDVLGRAYPADHPVGRFGTTPATTIGALTDADLTAPFYLAPLAPETAIAGAWAMPAISDRLRAPDGCPWDREQTHESLRNQLLEEAYEVYDALEAGATPELAGELGDLWLQIVLHAQLAAEEGVFDLTDVQAAIASKIVRRHPHVFGDAEARTASDVNRQWERIKAAEREDQADGAAAGAPKGALDGISGSLPALAASQEMQERAANIGYDWPTIDGVLDKVVEETNELREAAEEGASPDAWAEELGDLLFVLVNVARKRGVEAEAALRAANAKFRRRFGRVEAMAAARGVALRELDFSALDELWDAAKAEERITT